MSKVLIIEDDPYVRTFYQGLVVHHKYDVDLASSGEKGIERVKSLKPGLVFLGKMMSGMTGLEVLKILKNDPETKDVTIIMLTGYGDTKIAREASILGAGGFIIKSHTAPEHFAKEIERYLES